MNTSMKEIREKYYHNVRIIAVFIIGPFLIFKGHFYDDKLLLLIGILLIIWDGMKILQN